MKNRGKRTMSENSYTEHTTFRQSLFLGCSRAQEKTYPVASPPLPGTWVKVTLPENSNSSNHIEPLLSRRKYSVIHWFVIPGEAPRPPQLGRGSVRLSPTKNLCA
jgi:hypothetical protein